MATNPKPENTIWYVNIQRTVRKTDTDGPKSFDSFEMQRKMMRIILEQCEAFVSKFLDGLRQGSITSPEFRRGEVFQIALHFPDSKDFIASLARTSNFPA
jgi:hypothetical protein